MTCLLKLIRNNILFSSVSGNGQCIYNHSKNNKKFYAKYNSTTYRLNYDVAKAKLLYKKPIESSVQSLSFRDIT